MNWYKVFYWITVADGVKSFFDFLSNCFTVLSIVVMAIYIIMVINYGVRKDEGWSDDSLKTNKYWITSFRRLVIFSMTMAVIGWAGYVFVPTKKDALIIVAGGAVGNFVTRDTSAREVPHEVMTLLRAKIKSEIEELEVPSVQTVTDTLTNKTKDELLEIIRRKQ